MMATPSVKGLTAKCAYQSENQDVRSKEQPPELTERVELVWSVQTHPKDNDKQDSIF